MTTVAGKPETVTGFRFGSALECGAADPEAAGWTVRPWHRDRCGRHRRRAGPVRLIPGRFAQRDQPARHQPAHCQQRPEPHRRDRGAADHGAGHDRPDGRRAAGAEHRGGQQRQRLPQPLRPLRRNQRPHRPGRISRSPVGGRHQRLPGPLLERGHRPSTQSPCLARRPPSGSGSTTSSPTNACGSAANGSTWPASSDPLCWPPPSTPPSSSATPRQRSTSASTGTPPPSTCELEGDQVNEVDSLLAATANPENPSQVNVSQPSSALVAQADAKSALNGLFLGLGAVALLVGAVGVANIMIISVLERRSEIGLRRALGATKGHIRTQFLSEAALLGTLGGAVGVVLGIAATAVYAHTKSWATVIPTEAWTRRIRGLAHHRCRCRTHARATSRSPLTDPGPLVDMSMCPSLVRWNGGLQVTISIGDRCELLTRRYRRRGDRVREGQGSP